MSVQKKNDIYYAVVMYKEAGEKKYKWIKSGKSFRDAQALDRQLRTDMDRGEIVFSKKTTVKAFCDEWMEIKIKPTKSPATVANYTCYLNNIYTSIGDTELSKLSAKDLEQHYVKEKERGLSGTSVQCQHAVVRQALEAARAWRLITKNPALDVIDPPSRNKPKYAVYTPEQAQILLDAALGTEMYIPTVLGFTVGLRRGEICGLRLQDIDLKNKCAKITHSLDRMKLSDAERLEKENKVVWYGRPAKKGGTVLALGPLKTDASEGYVPLPDIVITAIKKEILEKKKQMLKFGKSYKKLDFLWSTDDGLPQDPDHLYHGFQLMIETHNKKIAADEKLTKAQKAEQTLPMIRPHDMRHTHATLLLRKKIDIKIVSQKLRHKRASFTQDYYQHVQDDMQSETASAMDELFTAKGAKKPVKSS